MNLGHVVANRKCQLPNYKLFIVCLLTIECFFFLTADKSTDYSLFLQLVSLEHCFALELMRPVRLM